jgi:hypothetical protein
MGCFLSLCSTAGQNTDGYDHGRVGRGTGDCSNLLGRTAPGSAVLDFAMEAAPTPLLKDVDFAVVVDDDNDEATASSGENEQIERMLEAPVNP